MKTAILIATVSLSLALTACQATFKETTNNIQDVTSLKIKEVNSINSGSRISWNIDVNSQYSDTVIGIGEWNYEDAEKHNLTELRCNNYNVDCKEIKKVECDLISESGSYETLECKFVKANGDYYYGNKKYIDIPYTLYDKSTQEYRDTLISPTIKVNGYDGCYAYILSYVFNVNFGDFIAY